MSIARVPQRPYTDEDRIKDEDSIIRAETICDYLSNQVAEVEAYLTRLKAQLETAKENHRIQLIKQLAHDLFGTVEIKED